MTDPVSAYATDVCAGRVIASRLVRMACARHLRDLEQQHARGLAWRPDRAQRVIDFFAEVLCLPDEDADGIVTGGKPFVLSPFQAFIAGSLMGWYTTAGFRRFRVAYVETAKGSGKTPFGAGLMLYLLVADGERGAQVYAAAVTKDQAKLAFTDAENMVRVSPYLNELVDQKVNNLAVLDTRSFFRPISAEKRGLDGKRVHGALVDELHEHPSNIVTVKMRAGTKNRQNALVLEITNSGFDQQSVCWEHHELSRQVLQGTVENDAWFAFVCHLDACDACYAAGKLQPADECHACDDWKTEGAHWLKANPNLGVSLSWQYLREQVAEAVQMPSQRNIVRRLNFCQWTQQKNAWIPVEAWGACQGPISSASLVGRTCYLGIDLSDKLDLSSVVAIFPRERDRPLPNGADLGDESAPVDRAIDVLSWFWQPRATLERRTQEDHVPFARWVTEGALFATAGTMIDHDAIVDYILTTVATKYQIAGIGIDQAGASAVITRLRRAFGDALVHDIPQGFRRLNTPCKMVEALVMSRNLCHAGNPVMDWCLSNLATEENSWREIRPVKLDQRKRIDGGVALIVAVAEMLEQPFDGGSVYATRGLQTV